MSQKIKSAFLLAAGFGTRMGTHTDDTPKPLLKIDGIPLIACSLYMLKRLGVETAVVNTHYKASQMETFIKNVAPKIPFEIFISHEPEILGTAGGIKKALAEKKLQGDKNFYLLNTDVILQPPSNSEIAAQNEIPENCLSYLFLKEKDSQNKETGWDKNSKNQIFINRQNGKYYYIGFSILNPLLLASVEPGQPANLGDLWSEASPRDRLAGDLYKRQIFSCGNKEEYEGAKNILPEFLKNDPRFVEFCELIFS